MVEVWAVFEHIGVCVGRDVEEVVYYQVMKLTLVVASLEVCEVKQVLAETEDWTWGLVLIDLLMVK